MKALRDLGISPEDGPKAIAKALADRAGRGEIACISLAISALDLAFECDLDEEEDALLARVGQKLRASASWVDALVASSDFETLESLARLDAPAAADVTGAFFRQASAITDALGGSHRTLAARVLGALAERHRARAGELASAVPRLVELLEDDDARAAAIDALAAIGDPRAKAPIAALLADPRVSDRTKAWHGAEAALRLGITEAAPALVALFERTDEVQRSHCVRALETLDPVLAAPVVAREWNVTRANAHVLRIVEAGALAGDATSLRFLERATREMGHLRSNALTSLAKVKGAAAFGALCAGATDESDLVRWAAVAALRELRDPRSFDALVASLPLQTSSAATALQELGDPRAIPHLVAALAKDHGYYQLDVMMKESLIEALGDFGHDVPEVWKALVARLHDRSDHVGECAAIALQQLRPGCTEGVAQLARKMSRIPNVPALVERNTLPMLARLRLEGPPRDPEAARAILAAMKHLRASLDGPKRVVAALDAAIARWSRQD